MRNNHAHAVCANYGQDIKRLETQLPLLKSWAQKWGSGTKAGCSTCRLHSTAPRGGQTTQATPLTQPQDTALTSPHIWNHLALPAQRASKGNLFVFVFPCCSRNPNKVLAWKKKKKKTNSIQFVVIYTVKGFGIISKAEVDVFLLLFCFFDDPTDVGNLISGSSAFSKSSLSIWKFIFHILLKSGLENFEHYFASM